jgi:ribosomal protein S18 acetylase RimI-like enzyme
VRIRAAEPDDVEPIAAIVERAYGVYIERIGMRPGPMDDDYGEQVRRGLVHVAEDGRRDAGEEGAMKVVGLIVLVEIEDRLLIENVAVDPARQSEGVGRRLLEFAEETARRSGIGTVVLYTHEKMTENLALYARLGYVEDERRPENGFARVFMSKRLALGSSGDLRPL